MFCCKATTMLVAGGACCWALAPIAGARAQDNSTTTPAAAAAGTDGNTPASFRPSIAVIVGVLTTMFSLTFLLLIYAKHCKRARGGGGGGVSGGGFNREDFEVAASAGGGGGGGGGSGTQGVDPCLVQALPTFSFSSLKGKKEGLECAVCLSRYEGSELLRFLPKCKHAFHVDCVDTWLACRSTCPLCRHKVSSEDALVVDEMVALMLSSRRHSVDLNLNAPPPLPPPPPPPPLPGRSSLDLDFQIYVHREDEGDDPEAAEPGRRFCHRIILSDVVLQRRWSDLVPSDVLFLGGSQTLVWPTDAPAVQQQQQQPVGKPSFLKRALSVGRDYSSSSSTSAARCMSEITGMDRLDSSRDKQALQSEEDSSEQQHRRWGSIARRTMEWLTASRKQQQRSEQAIKLSTPNNLL